MIYKNEQILNNLTGFFENPHLRCFAPISSTDLSTASVDNTGDKFGACGGALRRLYYAAFWHAGAAERIK